MASHLSWKVEGDYDYSSTQVNLGQEVADRIMAWGDKHIAESDIYDDDDGDKGLENTPHITILYGIVSQEPDEITELLANEGPVKATLGKVTLFENSDDYDVVKIDVASEGLARLHKLFSDNVENESDFPEYKPHVTIAYVKQGSGKLYSGSDEFEGTELSFDEVVFSSSSGDKTSIALKRSVTAALNWST